MLSIGELVDKLIIENIKIYNIRENLHNNKHDDEEYVNLNNNMNILNKNRNILITLLDDKIDNVINKKEKNIILQNFKLYKTIK